MKNIKLSKKNIIILISLISIFIVMLFIYLKYSNKNFYFNEDIEINNEIENEFQNDLNWLLDLVDEPIK